MWPLYLLFNKILKTEDERELKGDNLSAIDPYLFQHSSSNNNIESHLPSLRRSLFVDVPHVSQIYTWDCGLACVSMVLKTIGVNDYGIQALAELCSTNSVWTVDLAYLLQRFSVAFSYLTVTFGANPNYSVESFYKEELPNDLVRVDMLFQRAVEAGIDIQCRSISGREISILILSGKYIAIALVDQSKLSHVLQDDVHVPEVSSNNPGYTGHYVLICGYDAGADMFEIRDPASSKKHKRISSKSLEEARKAFGTDEDLLLISLEKSKNHHQLSKQLSTDTNMDSSISSPLQ
ncbi:Complement component 1 Q subcomponent-binding protein, mitochondrial [Stylosanthes scabra]|uniref:Complement component 1 Q subcomponent-binding protein, mitochondrial n=1 Tax=Stylosanthes scabra TaxID=79078 RepID=A0ABU6VCX3_9FABA|nr:Complement component 1 Q subcomponent-binding protein, mitochondrial [Stylosanthes scabra]